MEYLRRHKEAQQNQQPGYTDPQTGMFVMTEAYLRQRGKCCGNGCRHCPYGRSCPHEKQHEVQELILPDENYVCTENAVVLFWSGGKDSYLALLKLQANETDILLLTTYANGMVGHQEIPIATIKMQAAHLRLPLLLVPLQGNERYEITVSKALQSVESTRLAFGDLHLQGIRDWRERFFHDYTLLFPIWLTPYEELLPLLWSQDVDVRISALGDLRPP